MEEQLAVRSIEMSKYCDCMIGCMHEMGDRVKCESLNIGRRRVQMSGVGTPASWVQGPWV